MLAVAGILLVEAAGLGPWWSAPFRVSHLSPSASHLCLAAHAASTLQRLAAADGNSDSAR